LKNDSSDFRTARLIDVQRSSGWEL